MSTRTKKTEERKRRAKAPRAYELTPDVALRQATAGAKLKKIENVPGFKPGAFIWIRRIGAEVIKQNFGLVRAAADLQEAEGGRLNPIDAMIYWLILGVCDQHGNQRFTDTEETRADLLNWPYEALVTVSDEVLKLSGAMSTLEERAKN